MISVHPHKIASYTLFLLFLLLGCTPRPAEEGAKNGMSEVGIPSLERDGTLLLNRLSQSTEPESLSVLFTYASLTWIEEMEQAARFDDRAKIEARTFDQQLVIIAMRYATRAQIIPTHSSQPFLALAGDPRGVLRYALSLTALGPWQVDRDRGWRGLKDSPQVPVLLWLLEEGRWKLDLVSSMPVVTRGFASIAKKKGWSNSRTARYLIGMAFRTEIDEGILDP